LKFKWIELSNQRRTTMRTTRVWHLLSILTIAALLLAACAQSAAPAGQPAAGGEGAAEGGVTIRIWDFGGAEFEWIDTIAIPAWEKEHPDIKIEHLGIPETDYSTKLETALVAGEGPDIALQSYTYRLWKAGHVAPLDDFFARDGFKSEDFYPIFQSWCMLDGKVYCMPVSVYIWAMLYNKDLFAEAGLPELTTDTVITFDDWLEYARAVNKPADQLEERVWGSVIFTPNWNAMNNYMSDPFVLGADGHTCTGNADNEAWMKTWENLVAAYTEDLTTDSGSALLGEMGADDMFRQGKLGMIYGTYGNAREAANAGINVGLTGQPVVTEGWEKNVGSWGDGYALMAASEHPEEAWEFLKFLGTEVAELRAAGECASCGNPPAYRPAAEGWAGDDPLKQDSLVLLDRVAPPPFSPDIWTSVDPFYEAWRRMTEDQTPVAEAVTDATTECQEITDDLWASWEELGQ
jgi:multiple sugar transport system substrate-binding protein